MPHSLLGRWAGASGSLVVFFGFVSRLLVAATPPDPEGLTGIVLGDPPSSGSLVISNATLHIQARGAGLGGRGEQGYFACTTLGTNDFDLEVRVRALNPTALSARAGLMVREDPTPTAAMAAIVVTPGINGVQFLARTGPELTAAVSGFFPGNLPHAWLRLQRSNEVIRGFASLDGQRWTMIGKTTLTLTNALVGLAVSSAQTNTPTSAVFTDWAEATGDSEDPTPLPVEPAGPSSRRTALAITEIHYNPPGTPGSGERPSQFIELFNSAFTAQELGGHRLEAATLRYVFPDGFVLPAGAYAVIAKDPAELRRQHPDLPDDRTLGPWQGDLDRAGDTVRLWSPFGALQLEVPYSDREPWPLAADGEGHTLVLARPSWGEADPRAWAASQQPAGSPGRLDAVDADSRVGLRLTEVFTGGIEATAPFFEVFNAGVDPAPLIGVTLGGPASGQESLVQLPAQTLAPGARLAVAIPPSLPLLPSPLFLRQGPGGRVWDAVSFRGADPRMVLGRVDLNRPDLRRLNAPTPGQPNAQIRRPRLVISEVMYQPISGRDDDQYLEIWNPGSEAVSLAGWRLADGVTFRFPAGRGLAPGERAVVARNSARLRLTHPNLPAERILGEFDGRLGARGERLTLLDETEAVEFAFTYGRGGEWPALADGGGSSLELLHPDLDPDLGSTWVASDESARATWRTYEVTGRLEGGTGAINDIRVLLLGPGETLVDQVEVFAEGSTNLLTNPDFEAGLNGWTPGGTHERSSLSTNGGFAGSAQSLHLRASARGDNGINSVRAILRTGLRPGTNTTLRLRARWLSGNRDLLLRVKGNYLELPVRLDVPEDLGSPGLPNSRSLAAPRPALADLAHFPILPGESQPVRVTVRVVGNPGPIRPVLRYRIDPATDFAEPLIMNDGGVDSDRVPDDGVYTAVIPGQAARSMAAFHVTLGPESAEFRVPRTNPGREALVRWGEAQPAGNLGTYRLWITRATETRWTTRPRLHNGDLDATFVYGATRAVYGLGTLYSGSPFVSPGYNGPAGSAFCGYVLHFPDDDPFLGEQDFVMDWPVRDDTRQLEQRAYQFAAEIGLPYLHRRFVHLFVNSSKRGPVYEDTQQPGSAYLRNWSPGDDDGNLHKIEDWFEFSSGGEMEFNSDAILQDFRRADGSPNVARYRWNFRPRAVQESAHDFAALFRLIDAAVSPPYLLEYQRDLEREMDIEQWAGVFAFEHAVGNWDSFGYSRGKNMYAYRPRRGPWVLYPWDIDFVMSASGEGPGNYPFATIDSTLSQLYQLPFFQRAYWRAINKLVHGPMLADRFLARTEAVRLGLLENGVSSGNLTAARNYVRDQRSSLLTQLAQVDRPFNLETSLPNGSTSDPLLLLQGQGPLEMTALRVNGALVPVQWFQADRWYAFAPLRPGPNAIAIAPVDATGRDLGAVRNLNAHLTQPPQPDAARIVFNEIHASPRLDGAAFVELHNPSASQSFDLSGLQVAGSGTYLFPPNTFLLPSQYLVLGVSVPAFQAEFGRAQYPAARLPWNPNPLGETLALVRPAQGTNPAVTITAVTYRPEGPWPATIPGRSLQLRDPSRGEDDRVGDWAVYSPPANPSAWREFSVSGRANGTNLLLYVSSYPPSLAPTDLAGRWSGNLTSFGFSFGVEFFRDAEGTLSGRFYPGDDSPDPDLGSSVLAALSADPDGSFRFTWSDIGGRFTGRLAASGQRATGNFTFEGGSSSFTLTRQRPAGTVLVDNLRLTLEGDDTNLLRNGGFQSELGPEWSLQGAHQNSTRVDVSDPLLDQIPNFALRLSASLGGDGTLTNAVSQSVAEIVPGSLYHLSGRYQSVEAHGLLVGLEAGPRFIADLRPRTDSVPDATPGRSNSVAETLEPIPLLWVNEIQPENLDGPPDASGRLEPWLEIHNSGTAPASLDGCFLTDDPLVPGQWAFPPGTQVPAGGFVLVWLDGETTQGTPDAPHASFRPGARDGVVVLSRARAEAFLTVDFLRYESLPGGRSFGHLPDGWVHADEVLPRPTPGRPNGSVFEPERVWINEWMANNDGSVRDPADQDSDDWFELYNPGSTEVNLAGWFLTDNHLNPTKFRIPDGYRLPAGGFFVVWADEESGQNQPTRPDLHVNFRLSADGEEIALYQPDGTLMDHVIFGPQTPGVSQGRPTDGAAGTNFAFFVKTTPGHANVPATPTGPDILGLERLIGGALRVRFAAEPGARYRLRIKDDLGQPTWTPTTVIHTATGPEASLDWPVDSAPQRFLQVERLP